PGYAVGRPLLHDDDAPAVPTRRSSDLPHTRSSQSGRSAPPTAMPPDKRHTFLHGPADVQAFFSSQISSFPRRGLPRLRIRFARRSAEHTSELQSRFALVCRLLLERTKT